MTNTPDHPNHPDQPGNHDRPDPTDGPEEIAAPAPDAEGRVPEDRAPFNPELIGTSIYDEDGNETAGDGIGHEDGDDEPPAPLLSRRKMLQGLAGTAVVAGGIVATSNNASSPVVQADGTRLGSDAVASTTTSTTGAGGAQGSSPAISIAGAEAATPEGGTTVGTDGVEGVGGTEGVSGVGDPTATTVQVIETDQTIAEADAPTTPTTVDPPIVGQENLSGATISGAAPVDQRVLVLIELQGGSDGLSLVVPDDARYRAARGSDLTITPAAYNRFDDQIGLHPSLVEVSKLSVATIEGVGPIDGNLSHFKMAASWERGDVNSSKLVSSGFCGRVADAVNLTNGFAGVSVGGRTGFFDGGRIPALVMSEASELDVVTGGGEADFRRKAQGFTNPIGANWVKLDEMGTKLRTGLRNPPANTMTNRGKELGKQLYLAAELIKANIGVKVLYANLGSFDTHDNQERRLRFLWEEFDYAVAGFFGMLEAAGIANRALVATTSEFGRRLNRNARGTDHGSASNLIMVGPIQKRRYGAFPSLTNVDGDGNLRTEVPFDRYYATLAKDWMGVDPSLVLPGDPRPLGLT
ncbi:MAG: DUF1501 domain-containing protein [Actinomycetota bacterium]